MKRFPTLSAALAAALIVSSCGVVPTPPVALPDVTLDLQPSAASLGRVVYVRQDALGGAALPGLLQGLSLSGTANYVSAGGDLSQVGVYVRTSLDGLPGTCTAASPLVVLCEASGETAQAVGTLTLAAGQGRSFTLSGSALDAAGRAGHGYFGVRVIQGSSLAGEQLRLTELEARARL